LNLGVVIPCIFNRSNKNTQLDATINRKIYCFVVQTLPNMSGALPCPSSGARQTAVGASGLRMKVEVEAFSAVVGLLAKLLMMGMVMQCLYNKAINFTIDSCI